MSFHPSFNPFSKMGQPNNHFPTLLLIFLLHPSQTRRGTPFIPFFLNTVRAITLPFLSLLIHYFPLCTFRIIIFEIILLIFLFHLKQGVTTFNSFLSNKEKAITFPLTSCPFVSIMYLSVSTPPLSQTKYKQQEEEPRQLCRSQNTKYQAKRQRRRKNPQIRCILSIQRKTKTSYMIDQKPSIKRNTNHA